MTSEKRRLLKVERWDMRREIIELITQGYRITQIADEIGKKYGLTGQGVLTDWKRRKKWLPELAKIEDVDALVQTVILQLKATTSNGWTVYRQALKNKNENAAIAALKHISKNVEITVELLQSLGKVTKAAEKIDAVIMTPGPMEWEKIPEVATALEKIREKMRKEKAAEKHEPAAP